MIDFDQILTAAMDPDLGFGELIAYQPQSGGEFTITAVFDNAAHTIQFESETASISTAKPVLGVQLSQFPSDPQQGDILVRVKTGLAYEVADVNPDGVGHARLQLLDLS